MSLFNFFKKEDTPDKPKKYVEPQQQGGLPENFAQSVMELQMQMEFIESCDMDVVHQLNQLYRMAIQYYANNDTKKAEHFHRKLTSLLTNPNTIQIIQRCNKKEEVKTQQPKVDTINYNKNLKHELNKFNSQSELVVKSMIQGNSKKAEYHHRLISEAAETQEERLKRRIEARSRSKSKKKI